MAKLSKSRIRNLMRIMSYALASRLRNVVGFEVISRRDETGAWNEVTVTFRDHNWGSRAR